MTGTGSGTASEAVEYVWRQRQIWARTADRLKKSLGRRRTTALGLTIAAAVFATLADQIASLNTIAGKGLAMAAAVAIGLVPLVRRGVDKDGVSRWTRARAVDQALESDTYRYLAGVAPYRGMDRDQRLQKRVKKLVNDVSDMHMHTVGIQPIGRPLPDVHNVDTYVRERLTNYSLYSSRHVNRLNRRITVLRQVEFVFAALGVVLGAVAATFGVKQAAAWVGVVTTITVAVVAHSTVSRNEEQINEYIGTAAELQGLRNDYEYILSKYESRSKSQDAEDEFVARCEDVISSQSRGWVARWASSVD